MPPLLILLKNHQEAKKTLIFTLKYSHDLHEISHLLKTYIPHIRHVWKFTDCTAVVEDSLWKQTRKIHQKLLTYWLYFGVNRSQMTANWLAFSGVWSWRKTMQPHRKHALFVWRFELFPEDFIRKSFHLNSHCHWNKIRLLLPLIVFLFKAKQLCKPRRILFRKTAEEPVKRRRYTRHSGWHTERGGEGLAMLTSASQRFNF